MSTDDNTYCDSHLYINWHRHIDKICDADCHEHSDLDGHQDANDNPHGHTYSNSDPDRDNDGDAVRNH